MKKAMIINDSRLETMVLKDNLARLGYKAEIADEYDWMDKIKQIDPDIVIVNYTLQHISGDKIIAAINANFPNIDCYLSSCNKLSANQFADINFMGIIHTPVSLNDLEHSLLNRNYFCPYCGKPLSQSFNFCPFCGEKLIS